MMMNELVRLDVVMSPHSLAHTSSQLSTQAMSCILMKTEDGLESIL